MSAPPDATQSSGFSFDDEHDPQLEDPPPDVFEELKDWFQACMSCGIAEPALPSASGLLPMFNNPGDLPDFLSPINDFEMDVLPFSDIVENSPLCPHESYNAFPAARSLWSHPRARPMDNGVDDNSETSSTGSTTLVTARCLDLESVGEPGFRSAGPLSLRTLSFSNFDDLRSTPGYVGDLLSTIASLEIDVPTLCFEESCIVVNASCSDPAPPSRVSARDSVPKSNFTRPLRDAPILDDEPGYVTCNSAGVTWPADLTPVDEYDPRSEPEPPDPSCASH